MNIQNKPEESPWFFTKPQNRKQKRSCLCEGGKGKEEGVRGENGSAVVAHVWLYHQTMP